MNNWSKKKEPWCLCRFKWYRTLFLKNPLVTNRFYWIGWIDPETYLEWWYFGAPIRVYLWKRKVWVDFPFSNRRGIKMWKNAEPVELEN